MCADGGANRVFDALPRSAAPPDAILGDLDSIRPEVCQAYASGGVPVTDLSDDQDSTDLDKCIEHVRREMQTDAASGPDTIAVVGTALAEPACIDAEAQLIASVRFHAQALGRNGQSCCYVPARDLLKAMSTSAVCALPVQCQGQQHGGLAAGAIGGRLDHTLGNLNALYVHADLPLVLIGDGNFVRLLRRGKTQIAMNAEAEGVQCGVIPLGEPAVVTSRGLRWDMSARCGVGVHAARAEFGRMPMSCASAARIQVQRGSPPCCCLVLQHAPWWYSM